MLCGIEMKPLFAKTVLVYLFLFLGFFLCFFFCFFYLFQVLPIIHFLRNFVIENPLCVCSDEIAAIKKDLITDSDRLKLKQDTSQLLMKITQERYMMNLKVTVPDNYPLQQVS